MNRKLHFISGLPRSGSTLLVSILNQNPRFYAEISNPLCTLVNSMVINASALAYDAVIVSPDRLKNSVNGMIDGYYHDTNKNVIFNTNRGWTVAPEYLHAINPNFKMICMVRDYVAILNSYENLFKKRGMSKALLYGSNDTNVYTRTNFMGIGDGNLRHCYEALKEIYYGPFRNNILLIEYDSLVNEPSQTLQKIYSFIDEELYDHDFNNVGYSYKEYDQSIGVADLHTVRSIIKDRNLPIVLPPDLVAQYSNWEFWRN